MTNKTKTDGKTSEENEKIEQENKMTTKLNVLKELEGCECWTDAFGDRFGERVCVGIENGKCIHEGKSFVPTTKEKKDLWEDYLTQELGCPAQRAKDLEEEFGHKETIETANGTAKYVKTEVENDDGKWNDNYSTKEGYYVIHSYGVHHVYKIGVQNDTEENKPKVWSCGHTEDEHSFADTMFCVRDENWFKEVGK